MKKNTFLVAALATTLGFAQTTLYDFNSTGGTSSGTLGPDSSASSYTLTNQFTDGSDEVLKVKVTGNGSDNDKFDGIVFPVDAGFDFTTTDKISFKLKHSQNTAVDIMVRAFKNAWPATDTNNDRVQQKHYGIETSISASGYTIVNIDMGNTSANQYKGTVTSGTFLTDTFLGLEIIVDAVVDKTAADYTYYIEDLVLGETLPPAVDVDGDNYWTNSSASGEAGLSWC